MSPSIRIAYNNEPGSFEINEKTNSMVEYPYHQSFRYQIAQISLDPELLKTFFIKFNIKPTWINCMKGRFGDWGVFDEKTGHWTGAVGQVEIFTKNRIFKVILFKIEMKKADLAVFGFAFNLGRIKVAHFLPSIGFKQQYFWTRYPAETTKMWNLIYLFTPASWMWTFLSIASIVISLKIASLIGARLRMNYMLEEITLFPFW